MSEHCETECPRCGEPAVGTRFCPSCGLKIGTPPEMATPPPWEIHDVSLEAAGPPLEDVHTPQVVAASVPLVEAPLPDWWEVRDDDHVPGEASVDAVSEVSFASDQELGEATVDSPPVDPGDDAEPVSQHHVSRPAAEPWTAPRSRSRRVAFLCLAALIALVVLVPVRRLRR